MDYYKRLYKIITRLGIKETQSRLLEFLNNDDFELPDFDDEEHLLYISFMNYYNRADFNNDEGAISGFIQMNLFKGERTFK